MSATHEALDANNVLSRHCSGRRSRRIMPGVRCYPTTVRCDTRLYANVYRYARWHINIILRYSLAQHGTVGKERKGRIRLHRLHGSKDCTVHGAHRNQCLVSKIPLLGEFRLYLLDRHIPTDIRQGLLWLFELLLIQVAAGRYIHRRPFIAVLNFPQRVQ